METDDVILGLFALAQGTRLEALRLLVSHEPAGLAAGALAQVLGVPQNTLSTHLNVLANAGLVRGERRGRSIIYRADVTRLSAIANYLLKDCCGGHPEACPTVDVSCSPPSVLSLQRKVCP
jgi:ArsR family transcriptional regulator, arsenate/arsenite/antimonite-responsive transcriptional repressor